MYYDLITIVLAFVSGVFIRNNDKVSFVLLFVMMAFYFKYYFNFEWGKFIRNITLGLCLSWLCIWGFQHQIAVIHYGCSAQYDMKITSIDLEKDQLELSLLGTQYGKCYIRRSKVIIRGASKHFESMLSMKDRTVGEGVRLNCSILPIEMPTNPGESNFRYVYYGKMIVGEVDEITDFKVISLPNRYDLLPLSERIRRRIYSSLSKGLNSKYVGMALAMATGDKTYLSNQDEAAMRNMGLSHILVVSSLHVGLLIMLMDKQTRVFKLSKLTSEFIILLLLILLLMLCRSKISIIKCMFIYMAHLIALCYNRKPFYIISLLVFALLALCWNPYFLYNLSFTLSLMAYVGVFFIYRYTRHNFSGAFKIWYLTTCIYVAIAPLFIMIFGGLHYIGVFFSPLVMPLVEFIITLNFINVLVQYCHFVKVFDILMNYMFKFLEMLLVISKNIGEMFFAIPYQESLLFVLMYGIICLMCIKRKYFKKRLFIVLTSISFVCFGIAIFTHHYPMRVFYLDVGMGDGEFIYKGHTSVLIDGGTRYQKQVLINSMTYLGEKEIDYAILSHEHNDHYGAMFELMSEDLIKKVYMTPIAYHTLYDQNPCLKRYYETNRLILVDEDTKLDFFSDWTFELLLPDMCDDNKNNHSIICLLKRKDLEFLFTGDAELEEERAMLAKIQNKTKMPIEYLKVPHHGSITSSSESFLLALQANYGIISVGQGNQHGLPDDEVVTRYGKMGTTLYRTDDSGALEIRLFLPWIQMIHYKSK